MRPATQQEEAFLEMEEEIEAIEVMNLANGSPPIEVTEEVETFNQEEELRKWNEAQLQDRLCMEAEEHFGFEEVAARRALEELYRPYEKNLDFMRTVQNGAFLLVDEQRAEQASYRELVVLRHATERLLRVVDTSMHSVIQRER
ncbi:unnamed protein product [Closterium sp. NIES-53]